MTGITTESPGSANGHQNPGPADRAFEWWRRLTNTRDGDPAALARLRRAHSPIEALEGRAAADLARRLGAVRSASDARAREALNLARVLAHVKEHESRHPMRAAGWKRFASDQKESEAGDDRPLLAEARFKRLLQTSDDEEKVAAFIRLIALLGGTVNVKELARDFLFWNHPTFGDRVRERWAFLYYAADLATPLHPVDEYQSNDTEDDA